MSSNSPGYSISSDDETVTQLAQPGEEQSGSALRKHLLKPFAGFLDGGLDNPVLGALGVSRCARRCTTEGMGSNMANLSSHRMPQTAKPGFIASLQQALQA